MNAFLLLKKIVAKKEMDFGVRCGSISTVDALFFELKPIAISHMCTCDVRRYSLADMPQTH